MKHQLDCEAARAELAARTYGEPDGHLTVALEAHLESCAACRSARSEMTVARGFLDRGTPPLGDLGGELEPGASREVAQDVVRRVRRRGAWRSVLFGVAAALLGFVTLGALGTRAEVSGDLLQWNSDERTILEDSGSSFRARDDIGGPGPRYIRGTVHPK